MKSHATQNKEGRNRPSAPDPLKRHYANRRQFCDIGHKGTESLPKSKLDRQCVSIVSIVSILRKPYMAGPFCYITKSIPGLQFGKHLRGARKLLLAG